ncbi:hypothetical protein SISNIDRAFT_448881 [Sistotremastrum niveocremeum HHB9708]|uniref:Uncharacterized protein n=1 Tax=Sistotremastrum niveocremeum HHB9708 TaxID=1314777 RepID=A0A165A810_9AGAM|nr:hypothetical protein SISNIDRAFT_448881 [Sistotremastrum niveocremeum HHB9708]
MQPKDNNDHDHPPSYDVATSEVGASAPPINNVDAKSPPKSAQVDPSEAPAGQSYTPPPGPPTMPVVNSPHPSMPFATVYYYVHPVTGERISSLLPPDHPEMVCLQQGGHVPHTRFGILGVLAAIIWFPLGIGLCLLDRRVRCERCGYMIEDGCY